MHESEKAVRMEVLYEMFTGFAQPNDEDRARYYGNLTQFIPIEVFRRACRGAVARDESSFMPSPGQIIKAALELAPGARSPSHGHSLPLWYQKSIARSVRDERPQELEGGGELALIQDDH